MGINLLPEKEKKELEKEKNWKRVFVILVFILIFLGVFISILFPLKIYIVSKTESLKNLVSEKEESLKSLQFENFQETIKKTNEDLSKIQSFWQQQLFITPIFEKISSLTPDSIYFTLFSFQKGFKEIEKEGKKVGIIFAEVHVAGWAENREDLFYFKQDLEKEETLKDVNFSSGSWLLPANINFSLSFEFHPNDSK